MATTKTNTPPADTADDLDVLDNVTEMEFAPEVPDKVKRMVDKGYELWKSKPRKWLGVELSAEGDVKRIKRQAQTHARQTGRQFRTKKHQNPRMLVFRVTDAKQELTT